MSTAPTLRIKSTDLEQTSRLGEAIGLALRGGELVILASDLGGGKTALVKAIVKGAGSKDHVTSPSYTISNNYQAKSLSIHHYDFYRLQDAGIIKQSISEDLVDPEAVVIVEWADVIENDLPEDRLTIAIQVVDNESRILDVTAPEKFGYIIDSLRAVE